MIKERVEFLLSSPYSTFHFSRIKMDVIKFTINGRQCSVSCEVSSDLTLLDYIRNYAELRGTKYMCREGGCGACTVSVVKSQNTSPVAVNSCLVLITSCQGWEITTIENVGNRLDGYHPLQTTLAKENGTQCGHCTPGWVMFMYSLLKSNKDLTMLEIEKLLGANICRCTGYRPILEAFKKFAKDQPDGKIPDIEDLHICKNTDKICLKRKCSIDDWCLVDKDDLESNAPIEIKLADGKIWYKVNTVADIFAILYKECNDSYMLIAGNTAKGVYPKDEYPRILIDISTVSELRGHFLDQNLVIGAENTITETMKIFSERVTEDYFSYLKILNDHLSLVAHVAARNLGTLAGNLMIKHEHNEFASDIFLLFETVGAQLTIDIAPGKRTIVNLQQFLRLNMKNKVIINVLLPPLGSEYKFFTQKVMPRSQTAHAIVNAGFLYKLNAQNKILEARIVYGGLSQYFTRPLGTEKYLVGKELFTNDTLQYGIRKLKQELVVTENPPTASVEYRTQLAINLFYKGLLFLCPSNLLNPKYRTGGMKIHDSRPVSKGQQVFDTDKSMWPLTQPIPKLEALIQCSGEALYTEDLPAFPREVHAAFALSTVGSGKIVSIDPSNALKLDGVIAFYTAKDIPGINSFTPAGLTFYVTNEEILCAEEIKYFNQPIGIIVACARVIAERATKMIEVTYSNVKKPVIDIKEAANDPKRNTPITSKTAEDIGNDVFKSIKGNNAVYLQYHLSMETLVCVTKPKDDGLDVYAATQAMDSLQIMISRVLNVDQNSVDIHVVRLGGAFGIKISRESQVAIACCLVAKKLNRPCRFIQSLTTNMRAVGKRLPCYTDFEVNVNKLGVIQYNKYNLYEDNGYVVNEPLSNFGTDLYYNCYDNSRWNYNSYNTITDTPSNTFCRSPGTLENITMAECLMERIAYELSLDPLQVRLANLNEAKFGALKEMTETLKRNSDYSSRRAFVDKFNQDNIWTKRGLAMSFLRWSPVGAQYFDTIISVYHGDGTVVISHGAIEMGQGINTKVAQVCAYFLKIPLEKIKVKGNNTVTAPNSFETGGSLTSINACTGVQRACEELLKRLEPFRQQMENPTWEELIEKAFKAGVDLQARGFINNKDEQKYNIYGVALAEIELDILTGEMEIIRVDMTQDVGRSVSPEIDVGQVEGAFVMGLGYFTTEQIIMDKLTGEVLTNRTWNYFVPFPRDIPADFRVYFRPNSYSSDIFLGAKGTGEPPIGLSVVVTFALREAIAAARLNSHIPKTTWFQIDGAWTVEKRCLAAAINADNFKYN